MEPKLALAYLRDNEEAMLADVEAFVTRETPSDDKRALDDFAGGFASYASAIGAEVEVVDGVAQGNHVRARWAGTGDSPVLLLGHYDTVWPRGVLQRMPFRIDRGRVYGPGTFDMKVGLVQGLWAIRALQRLGITYPPVVFICNSDEELGSPGSARLIEDTAEQARAVLVLEPSLDGNLKTARKGVCRYRLEVTGRASHAGLDPDRGASATRELCRIVLAVYALADPRSGTTVNVGTLSGGTRANVIAAAATAEIDVRVPTHDEAQRIEAALHTLVPSSPALRITTTGGLAVPVMERTAGTAQLFALACEIAARCGFELGEAQAGGGSDGSRCAAVGAAVLDGLGAVGGGAHASDEHAAIRSIPERSALVASLIARLVA